MKKYIILIVALLLLQSVYAEQMIIDDIRVYVNENRQTNVDKDGGDIEDVRPNDVVEFRVDIKNGNSDEALDDVLVFAEIIDIDDGRDLENDLNRFTLRKGESERKVLTFTIPEDSEDDDYDVNLIIRGINTNNTEETYNVSYILEVITSVADTFNIRDAISNISNYCQTSNTNVEYVKSKIDSVIGPGAALESCQNEVSSAKQDSQNSQRSYEEKVREYDKIKSDWDKCDADYQSLKDDYSQCSFRLSNATEEANNIRLQASKSNSNTKMMIVIGLLVVGGLYWYRNNKGKTRIPGFKDHSMSDSRIDHQLGSKFGGSG